MSQSEVAVIRNRFSNYDLYYYYYIANKKYPPISKCQQFSNLILRKPNPNVFDLYMKPDLRSQYEIPLLFSQITVAMRWGRNLSMSKWLYYVAMSKYSELKPISKATSRSCKKPSNSIKMNINFHSHYSEKSFVYNVANDT